MLVGDLVKKHGLGIRVQCSKSGYQPFTVVIKLSNETFSCRNDDGTDFVLDDCLSDYELVVEEKQS